MPFRHERRRRFLSDDAEDVANEEIGQPLRATDSVKRNIDSATKCYTEAASVAAQRAVCTLFPSRLLSIALVVSACLMLAGGCLLLHVAVPPIASVLPVEDVAFLRLDDRGSVGRWLASVLMMAAGSLAVFIYSLRRHRTDDYHGRYRVWLWILCGCVLASLAETTGLGQLARAVCRRAAEWTSVRSGVLWPIIISLVAMAIGTRLYFEIRRCRWAVAALAAAACGFLIAATAGQDWPVKWGVGKPLVVHGSWLSAYAFVLATFLLYARHVQLEVSGAIVAPEKPKRASAKAQKSPAAQSQGVEPTSKPALRLRTDLDPVESSTVDTDARILDAARANPSAIAASNPQKHLSKSERRRLRRDARMVS